MIGALGFSGLRSLVSGICLLAKETSLFFFGGGQVFIVMIELKNERLTARAAAVTSSIRKKGTGRNECVAV